MNCNYLLLADRLLPSLLILYEAKFNKALQYQQSQVIHYISLEFLSVKYYVYLSLLASGTWYFQIAVARFVYK